MLNLLPGYSRNCGGVHRRDLLQLGALGGLGLNLPQLLAAQAARGKSTGKDVSCILIWTLGGTSHHDTFDPKPDAPESVRGEFKTISTAVPGIQFSELLPRLARELQRYAVLRSLNPVTGAHAAADYVMQSGHRFSPTTIYPCFGSVISHYKGFKSLFPPFVQLGSAVSKQVGGGTAGFLGTVHNPFEILSDPAQPTFTARDITLPGAIDRQRLQRRADMVRIIDGLQRNLDADPAAYAALDKHVQSALDLIASPQAKRAFDLGSEDPRLRDRYGMNPFGQRMLLARRLIEAGVRFVTVSDDGWDTHADNFKQLKTRLMPPVDQALPELLIDLEQRGMLDTTLVVWLTDFGRTPQINAASGRDHWATAAFAVMAGAGIPGGAVLGKTDPEGGRPIQNEYFPEDTAATIYTKLGVPLDLLTPTLDGREIRLNDGRPIREWM